MISVIIPIYNVEPYLGRCIDSVLRSDYAHFELILVDDGSTDGCLRICEEYAKRDSRVKVLSQENRGVSTARNRGLEVCRGEWVVFVDADDCISPDHLSLVAGAGDADLLLFDFAANLDELTAGDRSAAALRYGKEDMPDLVERTLVPHQLREGGQANFLSSNGKAFKRELIDRYSLRFAPELSFGEDKLFNLDYCFHAESCAYLPVPVYFYEIHSDSLSRSVHLEQVYGFIAWAEQPCGIGGKNLPSSVKQVYSRYVLDYILYALSEVIFSPLNPSPRREQYAICARLHKNPACKQALKQNLWLAPLEKRIFLFFFYLGCYRTARMLCTAARFRQKIREHKKIAPRNQRNGGSL